MYLTGRDSTVATNRTTVQYTEKYCIGLHIDFLFQDVDTRYNKRNPYDLLYLFASMSFDFIGTLVNSIVYLCIYSTVTVQPTAAQSERP